MFYKKIAGVVLCFNRPTYTRRTLKSLGDNTEVTDIDWFILQDGMVNKHTGIRYSKGKPHRRTAEIIGKSILPITEHIISKNNNAPGIQRYKALSFLKDYDLVYVFDDDMIVSKHYLRLLRIMAEQFPNDIGIMNRHVNKGKDKTTLQVCGHARLWGHYMNKKVYGLIKPGFDLYYNHMSKYDFHHRRKYDVNIRTAEVPYILDDVVINKLCQQQGVRKLWPTITRGTYIGKVGTVAYKTSGYWKKKGMDKQPEKIEYASDAKLKEFTLI